MLFPIFFTRYKNDLSAFRMRLLKYPFIIFPFCTSLRAGFINSRVGIFGGIASFALANMIVPRRILCDFDYCRRGLSEELCIMGLGFISGFFIHLTKKVSLFLWNHRRTILKNIRATILCSLMGIWDLITGYTLKWNIEDYYGDNKDNIEEKEEEENDEKLQQAITESTECISHHTSVYGHVGTVLAETASNDYHLIHLANRAHPDHAQSDMIIQYPNGVAATTTTTDDTSVAHPLHEQEISTSESTVVVTHDDHPELLSNC